MQFTITRGIIEHNPRTRYDEVVPTKILVVAPNVRLATAAADEAQYEHHCPHGKRKGVHLDPSTVW